MQTGEGRKGLVFVCVKGGFQNSLEETGGGMMGVNCCIVQIDDGGLGVT